MKVIHWLAATPNSLRFRLARACPANALHVTLGLAMLGFVLALCLLGHIRQEHAARVDVLSWYWHFVDAVWIVVFTVVYLIR